MSRVLQPGGVFLLITLGEPGRRLDMLMKDCYNWTVTVLLLPKIAEENQASINGRYGCFSRWCGVHEFR